MIRIKLYNYELQPFIEFLYDLKLVDRKSRMRTRFIKLLGEKLTEFENDRYELIKEYANLDEKGEPKIKILDNNQQVYDIKDMSAYNQAYQRLLFEEVVIEQNLERKQMLETIKDIVLNCGLEFEGKQQFVYDRLCEIVEQINYDGEGNV